MKSFSERGYKHLLQSTKPKEKLLKLPLHAFLCTMSLLYNMGCEQVICNRPDPGDPLGDFLLGHSLGDCWKS